MLKGGGSRTNKIRTTAQAPSEITLRFLRAAHEAYTIDQFRAGQEMVDRVKKKKVLGDNIAHGGTLATAGVSKIYILDPKNRKGDKGVSTAGALANKEEKQTRCSFSMFKTGAELGPMDGKTFEDLMAPDAAEGENLSSLAEDVAWYEKHAKGRVFPDLLSDVIQEFGEEQDDELAVAFENENK